jgi:two-component system, chemotaxis family, response regulator Rcp1
VEDEPADVYLIRRAIADCCPQSRVWRVASGSDALAFLRREPPFANAPTPALILLDLNLPQLDGRALLPLLRRLGAYQKTPVVIISVSERAVEEPRCRQLGATAYVEKSRDFAAYFGGVQASLRHWRGTAGVPS